MIGDIIKILLFFASLFGLAWLVENSSNEMGWWFIFIWFVSSACLNYDEYYYNKND